ncbi:MAG: TetR/AcrR family transcriptional regulator [Pseudomonadota bacterium]
MNSREDSDLQTNVSELPFELLEKNRPQQKRAIKTYETILESAAQLLEEIGVERISTNLIAERAGITVPALYRYFPNKYALLYALGARLMDRQNEILSAWFQKALDGAIPLTDSDHTYQLLHDTMRVTEQQTAGLAILRAMRALPLLQEARLQSHYAMTDWISQQIKAVLGFEVPEHTIQKVRLLMEVGTSVVEMAMEDPQMPSELALREGAKIQTLYAMEIFSDLTPEPPQDQ